MTVYDLKQTIYALLSYSECNLYEEKHIFFDL